MSNIPNHLLVSGLTRTAAKLTLSSPNKARSTTLNALHDKLEYERKIQDQLLLEQQKEIESLQSDLEQVQIHYNQANLTLTQTQNELNSTTQQIKEMQEKNAESQTINSKLKKKNI
eukprot:323464_1